jgi:glycerophosphoryl diester phosphodiesterase
MVVAGLVGATGAGSERHFFDRFGPQPLIIAHRGYRACYPENTLCAFEQSLGRSRMIEVDVQLSGDGVAVVFHDSTLSRTTNAVQLAGQLDLTSLDLCDWGLDQLRRLDLGSWFLDADPFGMLRRGYIDRESLVALMPQPILTLRELLAWATEYRMPLNIEIKDLRKTSMDGLIVPEVLREIRLSRACGQVVLSSFRHDYLQTCRHLAPEIATAALQEGTHPPDLVRYLQTLGVCAYHPENGLVDASLVKTLCAADFHVNVFTVNDPGRQRQLFRWGVTGIFTDFLEALP